MKWIKRAWTEVRQGQNVDLYLALAASAAAFILGIFSVTSVEVTLALAFAVLALLANTLIGFRWQSQQISKQLIDRSRAPFVTEHRIESVLEGVRTSHHIVLWGTTMSAHLPLLYNEIRHALRRNAKVQIFMIRRDGMAMDMATYRAENSSPAEMQQHYDTILASLHQVRSQVPQGSMEVRVTPYLAPYVAYFYNPEDLAGQATIRLGGYKADHNFRPTFDLNRMDDAMWYEYFYSDFKKVWDRAGQEPGGIVI